MRIHDQNLTGAAAAGSGRAQESQRVERGREARGAGHGSGGDRVELSSTLATLARALDANGADRTARVQELAAQYRSGRYRPDAAAMSRAMVGEALASGGQ